MKSELGLTDPYQTDDNTPTLTLVTADGSTAFPYHLVRSMRLGTDASRIDIDLDEKTVAVCGSGLGKLWRELRAYRVREISVNGGDAARQLGEGRVLVTSIELQDTEVQGD